MFSASVLCRTHIGEAVMCGWALHCVPCHMLHPLTQSDAGVMVVTCLFCLPCVLCVLPPALILCFYLGAAG